LAIYAAAARKMSEDNKTVDNQEDGNEKDDAKEAADKKDDEDATKSADMAVMPKEEEHGHDATKPTDKEADEGDAEKSEEKKEDDDKDDDDDDVSLLSTLVSGGR